MTRRPPETLADYVVVGIAPALITLLVGSLVFFLLGVFYQGDFPYRLTWVMGLFVMATVCVARISMEEGASYAALFGLPLAVVVGIAVVYFVEIQGPLRAISPLINWGLLGLIWWCTHKLTRDCTLIEDRDDTTGQGLLQSMGWEWPGAKRTTGDSATTAVADARANTQPAELAGVSEQHTEPRPWWERWFGNQRRPSAHGRWVVYFSVAALPLFGLGQWFIPSSDVASRRYAFWMLVIYVGSGLGLLLTTSFLGLRRYIRQRRLEMPLEMTATWLSVGVAMILGLLIVAALLPRPSSEYQIVSSGSLFDSPQRLASRMGWGTEGTKAPPDSGVHGSVKGKADPTASGQPSGDPQGESGDKGRGQGGSQEGGPSQDQSDATSDGEAGKGESGKGKASKGEPSKGEPSKGGPGSGDDSQGKGAREKSGESSSSQQPAESPATDPNRQKPGEPAREDKTAQAKSESDDGAPQSEAASPPQPSPPQPSPPQPSPPQPSPPQPAPPSPPSLSNLAAGLGNLLRVLFYLALAIGAAVLAWKYRRELLAAWQQLLKELRELWDRFNRRRPALEAAEGAAAAVAPVRHFRDFSDPFATDQAGRMSSVQLVHYSFEALQAWAGDFATSRAPGQTPHEFADAVGAAQPTIATPARQLGEIYSRIAYARSAPPAQTTAILQALWRIMREQSTSTPLTAGTADRPGGSV